MVILLLFLYYCVQYIDENMGLNDKWLFICNPIANGGKVVQDWPILKELLDQNGINYDFVFTKANNHAIELTQNKIKEGYRKFAVVGGDGSINEVVNGIYLQKEVSPEDIIFALFPLGTANDWSRTHKIPKSNQAALSILQNGKIKQQDIALAEFEFNGKKQKRYFNNVAGMAYDAFVAKYIEDQGGSGLNKFKYIYYVLYCLFKFTLPKAKISYGEQVVEQTVYTVNIGLCKYNGGGLRLVPQAIPDDGKLALTIAGTLSKFKVIRNMYRFYTGSIGELKEVIAVNTDEIRVEQKGKDKILLELDGEFVGYAPASFKIIEGKLNFLAP